MQKEEKQKKKKSSPLKHLTDTENTDWFWVAHTCNPGYSGGRDQKDFSSKPAWANNSVRPYLEKKPFTESGWWSGSRCRP
jgi:hypothetical protein